MSLVPTSLFLPFQEEPVQTTMTSKSGPIRASTPTRAPGTRPLPLQKYPQRIQTDNVNEFQNFARFIRKALVSLLTKDRTRGLLIPV